MVATQLTIDLEQCVTRQIVDSYSVHRLVYSLFPANTCGRILFRDKGVRQQERTILIFSPVVPKGPSWVELRTREVPDKLFTFSEYRFSVRMNPVFRRERKEFPIKGSLEQGKWFLRKCGEWGFQVPQDQLIVSETDIQEFASEKHHITQESVVFSGVLEVTDRSRFRESVENGIGRGKSFGFGLLEIIPIA